MREINWITEQIFTVDDFFTSEECESHIRRAESVGFSVAPITTPQGPIVISGMRNNTRVMIDDPSLADDLWKRTADAVPKTLGDWHASGVNERFRFYRYELGQQFNWHYDGAFERSDGECSHLTFMVYLNDDFEGGHTSFDNINVVPKQGRALFFIHQLRHKGQPVYAGRKYVLRTDVMYRFAPDSAEDRRLQDPATSRESDRWEAVHCGKCDGRWNHPIAVTPEVWKDVVSLFRNRLPLLAIKQLRESSGLGLQDSKSIQLHVSQNAGECEACQSSLTGDGLVTCPSCKSLNYNW